MRGWRGLAGDCQVPLLGGGFFVLKLNVIFLGERED